MPQVYQHVPSDQTVRVWQLNRDKDERGPRGVRVHTTESDTIFLKKTEPASIDVGEFLVRFVDGTRRIVTTEVFNDQYAFIDDEGTPEVKLNLDPDIQKADKEIEQQIANEEVEQQIDPAPVAE